jgi:hypothetical protein
MRESNWQTNTSPREMLYWLNEGACPRKLRQFALICCRRIWDGLNEDARTLLVLAEQYCNGRGVSKTRLRRSRERLRIRDLPWLSAGWYGAKAVRAAAWFRGDEPHGSYTWLKAAEAADAAAQVRVRDEARGKSFAVFSGTTEWCDERAVQAQLLREIYGKPLLERQEAAEPSDVTAERH